MKKIIVPITAMLFLVGVLGSVALVSGNANLTHAQESLEENLLIAAQNTGQTEDAAQIEDELVLDFKEQREDLAQEVQSLNEQWAAANAKPGWIHIVSQWQEDYDEIGVLPDGKVMEKEYIMDEWYLLNEHRQIIEGVFIRRDLNGLTTQVSVLRDNAWYNLTYNDVIPVPEDALPLDFVWDFGFLGEVTRLVDSLEKGETTWDGQPVILYTITERFASPINFSEYNEAVTAIKTRAYYEPESGKLLFSEQLMIMSGGEERTRTSVRLVSWDAEEQPLDEVLDFLEATYKDTFHNPAETTNSVEQEVMP